MLWVGVALALAAALILRKSRVRVVARVLIGLLQVGDPLPDFEPRLVSSGELMTPSDLAQGLNLMVFYRGRLWLR